MQQPVPAAVVLQAGQEHGDLGVTVGQGFGHHLDGRPGQPPVGALDDVKREA